MAAMTEPAKETAGAEKAGERSLLVDFRSKLTPIYENYFGVRAALADDDLTLAHDYATFLYEDATDVVTKVVDGWKDLGPTIRQRSVEISKAETIEDARSAFRVLSEAFISLEAQVGHAGKESWYTVHCPMAFGNEGADWLHTKDEVLNPYYGASMLKCGSVTEELDANANGDAK